MWNGILNVGGWAIFYLLLLLYVCWSILEQSFFSRRDPENWRRSQGPDGSSVTTGQRRKPSEGALLDGCLT
jgi:hypothetical protein